MEYLKGANTIKGLSRTYGITGRNTVRNWIRKVQNQGSLAIRRKRTKQYYSSQFKYNVLHWMYQTGSSLQKTAKHFGVSDISVVCTWHIRFKRNGLAGLEDKPKGRPSMRAKKDPNVSKVPVKHELPQDDKSRIAALERENELLRLQVDFLKKLEAFQRDPNAFLEKRNIRVRSNSKKPDID